MRQCPKCHKWTMDFDEYFRRFRCLDSECAWMAPSTTEREIRLLQSRRQPTRLDSVSIPELGLTLTPSYDAENDVISIDFGLGEATFDLPDPDGKMIWRIAKQSDRVAGFALVGAEGSAFSAIGIQFIIRRKKDIESKLPRYIDELSRGRVTKDLIDEVIVTAVAERQDVQENVFSGEKAWKDIVSKVSALATA